MHVDMGKDRHLWVTLNMKEGDRREIIVDKEKDVRICDGHHVIKIRFDRTEIKDVLIDDVFVKPTFHLEHLEQIAEMKRR